MVERILTMRYSASIPFAILYNQDSRQNFFFNLVYRNICFVSIVYVPPSLLFYLYNPEL